MVHIIAPAAAVVPQENAPTAGVEASAVGGTSLAALLRSPFALVSAGGAAVLVVGGLIGMMALGGEDEVAVAPPIPPAVETAHDVVPAHTEVPASESVDAEPVVKASPAVTSTVAETVAAHEAFLPLEPVADDKAEASEAPAMSLAVQPEPIEETRKLTLEVVEPKPSANPPSTSSTAPPTEYAGVPEVEERVPVETDPPVLTRQPDRRTNIDDQLSVAIDTIELPAMPINEFVSMISEMSAVPIRLDPKVLGDVGLSTRTQVVVKGGDITLGDLLARVLKEHQLTCVERDGELIVVRAKQ